MGRKSLTLRAMVEAFKAYALCPKCFKPYRGQVDFDHDIPLAVGGKDHDETTLVPLCKACHADKTKADRKTIAKTKRQAGETGQQARLKRRGHSLVKSRGFQAHRKFNGEIVRKD